MKNMIDPSKLAVLVEKGPPSFEEIASFLSANAEMPATHLCKLINVDPQSYFTWKCRKSKRARSTQASGSGGLSVTPLSGKKKKYSAEEKLDLLKSYSQGAAPVRAELLRRFGLYHSDIERWESLVKEAGLLALSKRKTRIDKKSDEQVELESLRKELRGQEKTITKLAALVVIQKKISEIMGIKSDT